MTDPKIIICKTCNNEIDDYCEDFIIHETVGDNWRDECICATCVNQIVMLTLDTVFQQNFRVPRV